MSSSNKHSPEVRGRAVRMVLEHQSVHGASIGSTTEKIGCTSETLRKRVRQAERDQGRRPGLTRLPQLTHDFDDFSSFDSRNSLISLSPIFVIPL